MPISTVGTKGLAANAVDLTTQVTGTLPAANGGTGGTSYTPTQWTTSGSNIYYNSTGAVGVGTVPGEYGKFTIYNSAASSQHQTFNITRPSTTTPALFLGTNGATNDATVASNNSSLMLGKDQSGTFYEYMRINTEGYFSMAPEYRSLPRGRVDIAAVGNSTGGLPNVCLAMSRWGDAGIMVNFFASHTSTTSIGNITNQGLTNTQYNTSSDYRLKENIAPMTGALAKVKLLKPCTYTWKSTGAAGQGFIAHELAEVVPDAVSGEKDAVDSEGGVVPQGIDTSYLVATLTAAIQELKAEFDAYKASHP